MVKDRLTTCECGAEAMITFHRFTYSYSTFGGLKVKVEGNIEDAVGGGDSPPEK
jgi:hypothetical protein